MKFLTKKAQENNPISLVLRASILCKSGQGTGSEEKQPQNCISVVILQPWVDRQKLVLLDTRFSHPCSDTKGWLSYLPLPFVPQATNQKPPQVTLVTLWNILGAWKISAARWPEGQKLNFHRSMLSMSNWETVIFCVSTSIYFWDTKAVLFSLMGDHLIITGPSNVCATLSTHVITFKF